LNVIKLSSEPPVAGYFTSYGDLLPSLRSHASICLKALSNAYPTLVTYGAAMHRPQTQTNQQWPWQFQLLPLSPPILLHRFADQQRLAAMHVLLAPLPQTSSKML
jgi:hypothetical protein